MTFQSFGELATKVVNKLEADRFARARAMKAGGASWGRIVASTGISMYLLKCELVPGYREKERQKIINLRSGKRTGKRITRMFMASQAISANKRIREAQVVPDSVFEELAEARKMPLSLSQLLLGDPLPGRSALDRKMQQTEAQRVFG